MKKISLAVAAALICAYSFAQDIDKIISASEVTRIEKILSSDDLKGRKTFSPELEKAGDFIAADFKKSGLKFFTGLNSYKQSFTLIRARTLMAKGSFFKQSLDPKDIAVFSSLTDISFDQDSAYEKVIIRPGANLNAEAAKYLVNQDKNYLIIVDTSFRKIFGRLARFKRENFKTPYSSIFVLSSLDPSNYEFNIKQEVTELKIANIVGVLPGKTRPDEYVVFSSHYDHLGTGKPNEAGDSIYNGANDDAAGTAAVMLLASYFSKLNNNDRTIIFSAFTAEEIGGYGARYFSKQVDPDKVKAMFNIEMIGTESKWGANSAYITGFEKSDMGTILQANLSGSKFKFEPDPYPEQQLFYRSDNATLAKLGVPAHTISTSKMDSEKFYHTQEDELENLDINNMTEVIKAIALSSKTIISGKDTPTRVQKEALK